MILYSKNELLQGRGVIEIPLNASAGFIYIDVNTYRQAVLIGDRFSRDLSIFTGKMGFHETQTEAVSYLASIIPSPVDILCPYLNLVRDRELPTDIVELVGILDSISRAISFEAFTKVPVEVRAEINLTFRDADEHLQMREEYIKQHTAVGKTKEDILLDRVLLIIDSFSKELQTAIKDALMGLTVKVESQPVNINVSGGGASHGSMIHYSDEEEGEEDEEEEDDNPFAAADAELLSFLEGYGKKDEEEEEEEPEPEPAYDENASASIVVEEEEEEVELTTDEKLIMMFGGMK